MGERALVLSHSDVPDFVDALAFSGVWMGSDWAGEEGKRE